MTVDLVPTRVTVTAYHIAHGIPLRCYACPIAVAVDDLLVDGYRAQVAPPNLAIAPSTVYRSIEPGDIVIPLPADAIKFVEDFDNKSNKYDVSPTTFVIPLPRHLLRNPASPIEGRP